MKRERINFTFDPKYILLSLQMGFRFVRAAVACVILKRISGLEPSSERIASRLSKPSGRGLVNRKLVEAPQ